MTSTALVPLNMSKSLIARSPELSLGHELAAIKATIRGICIEGALSILEVFGYKNTHFHYSGDRWQTDDFVNVDYFPECQGRMAYETPVFWFWGGPPNQLKWYRGNLQTLLRDRILCEIEARGAKEVAEWIGIDLTKVTR